jgi:hypothetical protein
VVTTVVCPKLTSGDTYHYQVALEVGRVRIRPLLVRFRRGSWSDVKWNCGECHDDPVNADGSPGMPRSY